MIEVTDASLQKAAGEGMDEFIQVFTDKYKEVIGGEITCRNNATVDRGAALFAGLSDFSG